jgi:hypothetical protein
METPTSFNLNDAVRRWRAALSQSPQVREEDLAELEGHLRDGIAGWQARGLTDEEAFLLAARRLGNQTALQTEYAKVNRRHIWMDRLLWMLVGVQLNGLVGAVSGPVADAAVLGGLARVGYDFQSGLQAPVLVAAALLAGTNLLALAGAIAAVCWWMRRKQSHTRQIASRLIQWPIVAGLLLVIFMLAVRVCTSLELPLLSHLYSTSTLGSVAMTRSLSNGVLSILQTVVLAAATVFLLRHRWIRAGATSISSCDRP